VSVTVVSGVLLLQAAQAMAIASRKIDGFILQK
jgi:hypothetical protein